MLRCYKDEEDFNNELFINTACKYFREYFSGIDDEYCINSYVNDFIDNKQKQVWGDE